MPKKPSIAPAPRASGRVTLASARSQYASRTTTAPAIYSPEGKLQSPRERNRAHRSGAFRAWARHEYGSRPPELLSPKLRRIVHGEGG